MQRRAYRFRIAAALLAAALGGCAALPPVGAPVAAPEPRPGDEWTWAVFDGFRGYGIGELHQRVKAVDGDTVTVEARRGDATQALAHTREWNPRAGVTPAGDEVAYDPPLPLFRFPLADGARWTGIVTATDRRTGARFPVWVQARVLGRETVATPAGEFDAVVIHRVIEIGDENIWRTHTVVVEREWYAPTAGRGVRLRHELRHYFTRSGGGGGEGGGGMVQQDWDRERLELRGLSRAPR